MQQADHQKIEQAVRMILEAIGEDPERDGLKDTPSRVARMYGEIFSGLHKDPAENLKVTFATEGHDELVLVKDIPFNSFCEHHLVPFYGVAHIGYIPSGGRVVGLSKLVRTLQDISARPQLQERITTEVARTIMQELKPQGVIVVIEAEHMCMSIRGVRKPGSKTVTSAVRGSFRSDERSRIEAMELIRS
ncbi:MAG TPA: GTP cyclohydrolase I FolE [Tissierellia bacterium]|nr:GTP cyclohydrolase I FolE [Tissierellia bacterium]